MSKFSREKGKRGERELANELSELLGITLKRKVRNLEGESDIEGLPGFSVEVKNCVTLSLPAWWRQCCEQAEQEKMVPVLFYKVPRKGFRAVFSLDWMCHKPITYNINYSAETNLQGFAMLYREHL